ncbi:dnaJ homolog subfamily C member 14 [Cuculus canorus]|uniref:dnaJ homolog subfamily C member 14 n=1 Tax=Cuculus canorus TaxID=55661 RepID=UPI0023AADA5C|nr:dnaJ homolog subfamily C member 14 [Cuculus canorus]
MLAPVGQCLGGAVASKAVASVMVATSSPSSRQGRAWQSSSVVAIPQSLVTILQSSLVAIPRDSPAPEVAVAARGRKAEVREGPGGGRVGGGGGGGGGGDRDPPHRHRLRARRDGGDLAPAGADGTAAMEPPRPREAGDGGDSSGGNQDPPGAAEPSTSWNGSCRLPDTGPDDDEEEEEEDNDHKNHSRRFPSCRCRGEPATGPERDRSCSLGCPSPASTAAGPPAEDGEEDGAGKGTRRPRRRQRHRSAPKEKEDGSRRQRPTRKRSRGDGAEAVASGRGPVAQALSQARRLAAEAGERLLCSRCRLGAGGLGWAQAGVRSWGRRVGQRARSGSLRAARWLRGAAELLLRLLWMLGALLLLLLMLLLGCLRLCWRLGTDALAAGTERLSRSQRVAQLLALLDAAALRRTWERLRESPGGHRLRDWLRRAPPWAAEAAAMGDTVATDSREEVARLLALAEMPEEELNPFQVLGVEATASDAELRKSYRRLAVLVHPDKNEHPRAEAAFKVLRAAWDVVSSPERRREYEMKQMAESELSRSMGAFLSRLQDDLREAMNTMGCSKCQGKHRRVEVSRDPLRARYCGECAALHPAEEGDFWAESSLLGLRITYFARMDGKVYDITEWAGCQRVGIAPDTHRVPYHISFGSRGAGPAGRQRSASKGAPPSAADLQEFFSRVFQGRPGGTMPGGSFPTPPTTPGDVPRTEGAGPKAEGRPRRRKRPRRPLQR